jgi:hypothetical protein
MSFEIDCDFLDFEIYSWCMSFAIFAERRMSFLKFWNLLFFWIWNSGLNDEGMKNMMKEMDEDDEEIEIKINWWWYTVRFGKHTKSNGLFFSKKIK